MKAFEVVGYAADADIWCPGCFQEAGYDPLKEDNEGNPISPVFAGNEGVENEVCGCCGGALL